MKAFNEKIILRNVAIDPSGGGNNLIAAINTPVTVYQTGTTNLASLFDLDENPIANPVNTDIKGNVVFKVADGVYDIVGGTGENETRWDQVSIFDQVNLKNGVIVFQTYAELDAYTPTPEQERVSYKVTNDPDTSLNGYYSWVSGTTYTKDADLVENVIDENNTGDAVSGKAVADYVEFSKPDILLSNVSGVTEQLSKERAKIKDRPKAVIVILLGQSLNAARLSIAQATTNKGVKMLNTGCHVSAYPYWQANATWCIKYSDTLSTAPLVEGGAGQSPCSGVGNTIIGGSIKQAYIASIAVGSRDIKILNRSALLSNVHAFSERFYDLAVEDGFNPEIVFYSAHGEADSHINNADYELEATDYYKDCQLIASQVMRDPNYRAPVFLTYPMQSAVAGNWDQKIAQAISDTAKNIVNGVDAGAIYQWPCESDRVHPTPDGYVFRGEFIGRLIREYVSNNYHRDSLEMIDATYNENTVKAVFSQDIEKDLDSIAGTNLNTGFALDGFEVLQDDNFIQITNAEYSGSVVTLTTVTPLSGTIILRIANQETSSTLIGTGDFTLNIGSPVRTKLEEFGSTFDPSQVNKIFAKRQEIEVRTA